MKEYKERPTHYLFSDTEMLTPCGIWVGNLLLRESSDPFEVTCEVCKLVIKELLKAHKEYTK